MTRLIRGFGLAMQGGIRLAAAIACVAVLVVACGRDPVGKIIEEGPTFTPLIEERPLWEGARADGVSTALSAALHGETAVIVGDRKDSYRLAAVDAATGNPLWSIEERTPLPGGDGAVLFRPTANYYSPLVAGPPGEFLVFVPSYRDGCEHPTGWCPRENDETAPAEEGIAALSGSDGSVRWMTSFEENPELVRFRSRPETGHLLVR